MIVRKLKGLEDFVCTSANVIADISLSYTRSAVTVVSPHMGSEGWPFADVDAFPGADVDSLNGAKHVKDLYLKVQPDYSGR